jgi:hypothetical protein
MKHAFKMGSGGMIYVSLINICWSITKLLIEGGTIQQGDPISLALILPNKERAPRTGFV